MRHTDQRGAATVAVTLVLLLAFALAAVFAQRRHADEQRSATRRQHASQAFEAAEAGLEWGLAMLDEPRSVDAQCRVGAGASASFRERSLSIDPGSGRITVLPQRTWCARASDAWRCSCGGDDPALANVDARAAFELRFDTTDASGLVRLSATGCRRPPCGDAGEGASRRLQVVLGLVPAVPHPPVAALTVRGDVEAGSAMLALHNPDEGIALHAGGAVRAPAARYGGAAGAPTATRVENDAVLRATDPDRLFSSLFGLDKTLWRRQPGVASFACTAPCNQRLADEATTHRLVFVDGDLVLDGAVALGTPERPVAVVASGDVRLRGPVAIHGVLYGASLAWDDAPTGALVRGAAVAEGGYSGNAAPVFVHDAGVLTALKIAGPFARLPGSWKDFP